ncbi:LexA family transcriptional regulator [Acinetobacter lactucae]|uniref:LexA family transcriptional regulator n=1 Tax=Acinetobacter lactucae TaxID=1785128 RepID=UPI00237BA351|nr:XRE family transcriptional regulator [Acinetobacter lactucae]MDD9317901.1 S24 family peptidase [Acinetobacter lactucae]
MNLKEIRRKNLRKLIDQLLSDKIYERQEDFAVAVGIDKTYLSQMLMEPDQKGSRGVSEAKARQIEKELNLEANYLDTLDDSSPFGKSKIENGVIRPAADIDGSGNYVIIPMYDIKAACGNGYTNEDELIKGGLVFKESFIRKCGLSLSHEDTGIITGDGRSMEPTINHTDAILTDLRVKTIDQVISDKVYALVANKELRIKRLFRKTNGGLRIVSDNPDKETFPDEHIEKEDLDAIQIKGLVRWRCGEV